METPDITPGFPSKGERIGPAWETMYGLLVRATKPMDTQSLAQVASAIHPDVSVETARSLLHSAARAGLVTRTPHYVGGRTRTAVLLVEAYR
jgi:Fe2+ or Zn2+ uptake regulation protein